MKHWVIAGCIAFALMFVGCQPQSGGSDNGGLDNGGPIDSGPPGGDIDVSEITGPGEDAGDAEIDFPRFGSGDVTLPSGVNLSLANLRVVSGAEEQPVNPSGSYYTYTYSIWPSLVSVVDANDNVVLCGMMNSSVDEELSAKSTAIALIYFGMGGWMLPADDLYGILSDISRLSECDELTELIEQEMRRDPLVISRGSDTINEKVESVVAAMISREAFQSSFGKIREPRTRIIAAGDPFLILSPGTPQSGITFLLDSSAPQLTARNSYRRAATLYRVQTGYDDASGEHVDLPVVEQVGEPIELPGGETLTISSPGLSTLFSTSISSLWKPTETGPIEVPVREGATRTYYDLVVLGPSFDGSESDLLDRSRYAAIRSEWKDLLIEQRINTFLLKFLMPLAEPLGVGVNTGIRFGDQPPVVRTMRQLIEPILDGAGVSLHTHDGYLDAVKVVLERWASNRAFRDDLTAVLIAAYGEEIGQNLDAAKISAHMGRLARASSVRAAIAGVFANDDVGHVLRNLESADDVAIWSAEVGAVKLTPSPGRVSEDFPFVELTATVAGSPAEPLTYEWSSSSGIAVFQSLLDGDADPLTTSESSVTYAAEPASVGEGIIDTVTVRVVDANGTLLGAASVQIRGDVNEDNPCPDYVDGGYSYGEEMQVRVSSNVISGGQDVFVEVTYNFPSADTGRSNATQIEAFMSAACPRCNLGCQCDSAGSIPIFVDGERATNLTDWESVRWQAGSSETPEVQMFCVASGAKFFFLPEGADSGPVTHTFQFTIASDWPGCPIDEPDCTCPRLGGLTIDGEVHNEIQAWKGYFVAVTESSNRYVAPLKFDTNPLYESLLSCPDD
ncbi:MAG: hypothetical protein H6817_02910 [Phycisphaerales bacterium]|nr:hypothetical protein [Phycisphaerales bacterium]